MCFKLLEETLTVSYRDIRVYARRKENTFSYFFKNVNEVGNFPNFSKKIDPFIDILDNESLNYIKATDHGISVLMKNADLLDAESDVILRGSAQEFDTYMKIKKLTSKDPYKWNRLFSNWSTKMLNRGKFSSTSITVDGKVHIIQPIAAGSKYQGVRGLEGLGPDFSYTPELLFNGDPTKSIKIIKLTGSRDLDFKVANELAGLTSTPNGFTWHHLDDFDPDSGTATMQLVRTKVHETFSHGGGASMWKAFYGIEYK